MKCLFVDEDGTVLDEVQLTDDAGLDECKAALDQFSADESPEDWESCGRCGHDRFIHKNGGKCGCSGCKCKSFRK